MTPLFASIWGLVATAVSERETVGRDVESTEVYGDVPFLDPEMVQSAPGVAANAVGGPTRLAGGVQARGEGHELSFLLRRQAD